MEVLYSFGNNHLVNMMSVGATTTVNLIQPFEDECYVEAFEAQLQKAGIRFDVSERIPFTTPREGIVQTPIVFAVRAQHDLLREYIDSLNWNPFH